ncbi:MAG TPA: RNase adapter RapZ [Candidatus Angelobacter sp.]|jgi:aminoglycoside/choline kinase family phosphotransferase|nr:RNase adapter RapZ [Candidatus Angelobacter sp.]
MSIDVLKGLFEQHFRAAPERVQPLQGQLGGSGRVIVRLSGGEQDKARLARDVNSAIGILYDVREENVAFLEFSRHFRRHGLPVPEIFADDLRHGAYIEQDLGNTTLFEFLVANRAGENIAPAVVDAYIKVVQMLPRFQVEAGRDVNYKVCYPRSSFDRQSIAWDLNYFKYYFLRLAGIAFNEQALENDFSRLTKFLLTAPRDYFLYRDYQSRNVMLLDEQPFFLDYQGGRKGALHYDIASLLYDAKADLPPALRQKLLDHYIDALRGMIGIERDAFMHHYYAFVYVRIMQALGAYGFRGFYERKPHFLQSVPYAVKNLRWLLEHASLPIALPALTNAFQGIVGSQKLLALVGENDRRGRTAPAIPQQPAPATDKLVARIFSFSFHRGGPPKDETGHGGGFVFDARSLPNPGREERFKSLTGKDAAVIDYLRQHKTVDEYLKNAEALVDSSIANYQSRGFKSLTASFGCTGGQHRSVYLAEQLARHLRAKDDVEVVLRHIELEKMVEKTELGKMELEKPRR